MIRTALRRHGIAGMASIGLSSSTVAALPAVTQIDTARRLADEALYRAKAREGKNRIARPMRAAA